MQKTNLRGRTEALLDAQVVALQIADVAVGACAANFAHLHAGLGDAVIEEARLGVAEGTGSRAGRATGEEDLIGGALWLGVGEGFGFDFSDLSGRLAGHLLHTLATSLQVANKAGQALAADLAHVNARLVEAVFQPSRSGVQHRTVLGAVAAAADEALI